MIQRSSLSIRALYRWDNTIFDNFHLPEDVDKDILCSNILSELGELEVLYPDSDYMKEIIEYWSLKELPNWNKINNALKLNYDPTINYRKHTVHDGTADNIATNKVKAYNESQNFVDYRQDVDDNENHYERTVDGNIGIYSFQRLLRDEVELRDDFNIYDLIIRDFKLRFCLLVY